MKVKLLSPLKVIRASALIGLSLISTYGTAQTNVTVDASATWAGGMLVYENTPEQAYVFYSDWGVADVRTDLNTTDNTVTLYPNYNTYNPDDAFWSNGEMGNKIVQGMTLVVNDDLLGQNFTFSGNVLSNTIAAGYTVTAFVKTLDANWGTINEASAPLDPDNFTIAYDAAQYPTAAHIQYGFSVKGLNANPTTLEANGNVVVTAGTPEVVEPVERTIVPVNASSAWTGAMLVYENTQEQPFVFYSDWGIADVRTDVNTTDNTLTLFPNYNAYNATDAFWANGEVGNKIMLGISYVLDDTLMGQPITFTGNVSDYTISSAYNVKAFVKVLDANFGLINEATTDITSTGNFTVNYNSNDYPGAVHLQYGFMVKGLNANPTQEAVLGFARIGQAIASVKTQAQNKVTLYPNPTSSILNISSNEIIESVQIVNMLGQTVIVTSPKSLTAAISVNSLTNGIYVINTIASGKTSSAKFIKQ